MRSLAVLSATALIIGALCGAWTNVAANPLLWVVPPILLGSAVCRWFGAQTLVVALLTALIFLAGAALAADARERALHPRLRALLDAEYGGFAVDSLGPEGRHDPVALRFELKEDAAESAERVSLRGAAQSILLNGAWRPLPNEGVWLTVGGSVSRERILEWRAGRTLLAPVVFRRPARYLDDGVPDFERDLLLDGTALLGSVKSGLVVRVEQGGSLLEEMAASVRAHVRRAVSRWVTSRNAVAGAITIAVLIGDRTGLPDDIRARLQAAGTYHVIAISGGNIAILAGLALFTLVLLGIQGRVAAFVTIVVLIAYSQVVTAGPSVWRATLMAVLYLAARLMDHRTSPWHAMAVAAVLMVMARPLEVRDTGFILTIGATAALLESGRWAGRFLTAHQDRTSGSDKSFAREIVRRPARWVLASLVASFAVELVLLPVSALAFTRVTIAGIALNLLAVPLMAVVQIAGMALTLAVPSQTVSAACGWMANGSAVALVESARLVDALPGLTERVPSPGLAILLAYYGGLAALLLPWPRIRRLGGVVLLVSAIAIVTGVQSWRWPNSRSTGAALRLTVFDVGQAEAMLLQTTGAEPLAVDAGGAPFGGGYDVGGRVLAPALWAHGVVRLETLLITHGDPDHLGGASTLIDAFAPRRLWTGVPVPSHEPTRDLFRQAARAGLEMQMMRAGDDRLWGHARIRVLHPPEPDWERPRVRNDDSVVIEVLYGDVAMLLTGDIGADVERAILPSLTPARFRILKVAHHGSRTSSSKTLLEGWRPQIAVISCGRGNRFGHPTRDVLARLDSIGARVLRTDRQGQITIETDGRSVRTTTFLP